MNDSVWVMFLGDPGVTASYALCIYDQTVDVPGPAGNLSVGPSLNWLSKDSKGFNYKDKFHAFDGVHKIQLKTGELGRTKAQVKAKGSTSNWPTPVNAEEMFDQDSRLTVQFLNSDTPTCWESEFTVEHTKKNDGERFKAVAK